MRFSKRHKLCSELSLFGARNASLTTELSGIAWPTHAIANRSLFRLFVPFRRPIAMLNRVGQKRPSRLFDFSEGQVFQALATSIRLFPRQSFGNRSADTVGYKPSHQF